MLNNDKDKSIKKSIKRLPLKNMKPINNQSLTYRETSKSSQLTYFEEAFLPNAKFFNKNKNIDIVPIQILPNREFLYSPSQTVKTLQTEQHKRVLSQPSDCKYLRGSQYQPQYKSQHNVGRIEFIKEYQNRVLRSKHMSWGKKDFSTSVQQENANDIAKYVKKYLSISSLLSPINLVSDKGITQFLDKLGSQQFHMHNQQLNGLHFSIDLPEERQEIVKTVESFESSLQRITEGVKGGQNKTNINQVIGEIKTLFDHTMQEVMRQISLHCKERGQLVSRIWDGQDCLHMTEKKIFDDQVLKSMQEYTEDMRALHASYQRYVDNLTQQIQKLQEKNDYNERMLSRLVLENSYLRKKSHRFGADALKLKLEINDFLQQLVDMTNENQRLKVNEEENYFQFIQSLNAGQYTLYNYDRNAANLKIKNEAHERKKQQEEVQHCVFQLDHLIDRNSTASSEILSQMDKFGILPKSGYVDKQTISKLDLAIAKSLKLHQYYFFTQEVGTQVEQGDYQIDKLPENEQQQQVEQLVVQTIQQDAVIKSEGKKNKYVQTNIISIISNQINLGVQCSILDPDLIDQQIKFMQKKINKMTEGTDMTSEDIAQFNDALKKSLQKQQESEIINTICEKCRSGITKTETQDQIQISEQNLNQDIIINNNDDDQNDQTPSQDQQQLQQQIGELKQFVIQVQNLNEQQKEDGKEEKAQEQQREKNNEEQELAKSQLIQQQEEQQIQDGFQTEKSLAALEGQESQQNQESMKTAQQQQQFQQLEQNLKKKSATNIKMQKQKTIKVAGPPSMLLVEKTPKHTSVDEAALLQEQADKLLLSKLGKTQNYYKQMIQQINDYSGVAKLIFEKVRSFQSKPSTQFGVMQQKAIYKQIQVIYCERLRQLAPYFVNLGVQSVQVQQEKQEREKLRNKQLQGSLQQAQIAYISFIQEPLYITAYDQVIKTYGVKAIAEQKFLQLMMTCLLNQNKDILAQTFCNFYGLTVYQNKFDQHDLEFFLKLLYLLDDRKNNGMAICNCLLNAPKESILFSKVSAALQFLIKNQCSEIQYAEVEKSLKRLYQKGDNDVEFLMELKQAIYHIQSVYFRLKSLLLKETKDVFNAIDYNEVDIINYFQFTVFLRTVTPARYDRFNTAHEFLMNCDVYYKEWAKNQMFLMSIQQFCLFCKEKNYFQQESKKILALNISWQYYSKSSKALYFEIETTENIITNWGKLEFIFIDRFRKSADIKNYEMIMAKIDSQIQQIAKQSQNQQSLPLSIQENEQMQINPLQSISKDDLLKVYNNVKILYVVLETESKRIVLDGLVDDVLCSELKCLNQYFWNKVEFKLTNNFNM